MPVDYTLGESGPNDAPPGSEPGANPHVIQATMPSGGSQQSGGGVNPWAGILATLGGVLLGNYFRGRSQENAVPPELRQMLTMSNQRMAFQNPEFQAVTQGTYSMLPGFAREGTQLSGSLSNQVPAAPPSDSGGGDNPLTSLNPLRNPLLSGALGALLGGGLPGGASANLGDIARAIGNLFRGGDRNIFGGHTSYTGNPGAFDPYGGADNPYYYGNVPGYGGDPNVDYGNLPGYGMNWPDPSYGNLPGYGTNLPGVDPSYYEPGGPLFTGPQLPGGGDNNPGGGDWGDGSWYTNE